MMIHVSDEHHILNIERISFPMLTFGGVFLLWWWCYGLLRFALNADDQASVDSHVCLWPRWKHNVASMLLGLNPRDCIGRYFRGAQTGRIELDAMVVP